MFLCRYVADRLANEENQQQEQPQMQQSSSSEDIDMESTGGARSDSCSSLGVVSPDVDSGSIDELSVKFSVQGTSSSKSTGKKKVVSYLVMFLHTYIITIYYIIIIKIITF